MTKRDTRAPRRSETASCVVENVNLPSYLVLRTRSRHHREMKRFRVLLTMTALLLSSATLSGCGSSGPGTASESASQTPPGADSTGLKLSCEEAKFVSLLNLYRESQGRSPVLVSEAGVQSSRWHGEDMIAKNYFSHTEPGGRDFSSRAAAFGYPVWAENIAAGNSSASSTFCQWKNSSGHNANMLGSNHRTIGIGRSSGGGTYGVYWSNNFGPLTNDTIGSPITDDASCVLPTTIPSC